jgi:hypothetical protein
MSHGLNSGNAYLKINNQSFELASYGSDTKENSGISKS